MDRLSGSGCLPDVMMTQTKEGVSQFAMQAMLLVFPLYVNDTFLLSFMSYSIITFSLSISTLCLSPHLVSSCILLVLGANRGLSL